MIKNAILVQRKNEKTDKTEWALVSKKDHKVLKWFGVKKPSDEAVQKEEKRIQYFKNQGERVDRIKKLAEEISFPEAEYEQLKDELDNGKTQYTTRVDDEFGKYKEGNEYNTPWGDKVKVISKRTLENLEDHPFKADLTDSQKEEIGKYDEYEVLGLEKISIRSNNITKEAVDPAKKTADSLYKIIQFLFYRIPRQDRRKYFSRVRGKVIRLSPAEMASKRMPPSSVIGQSVAISKNILSGLNPVFVGRVLEELIRLLTSNPER